ncbi:hypothetical protein MNJPNG_28680 [Cupriavidus oxalaticus]
MEMSGMTGGATGMASGIGGAIAQRQVLNHGKQ